MKLLLVLVLLVLPVTSSGQATRVTFETITYATVPISFTRSTIYQSGELPMTECRGKLETAQIRIRFGGGVPTTTVGMLIDIGDIITVSGTAHLDSFSGIRTGATSGVVQWHCYRAP